MQQIRSSEANSRPPLMQPKICYHRHKDFRLGLIVSQLHPADTFFKPCSVRSFVVSSTILYSFFLVIPRRLNYICRRFGTFCSIFTGGVSSKNNRDEIIIPSRTAYEDGTNRVFRNVGIYNSDAGELPRRKHTTFRTRRKFEIIYQLNSRFSLPCYGS
jgi:hypothetical protein